jgi:tRNA (guanine-N7-)-methyltransferase
MDWASHYPEYISVGKDQVEQGTERKSREENAPRTTRISKPVEIADIGCGFGGLLFALAPKFPDTLLLGASVFPLCNARYPPL